MYENTLEGVCGHIMQEFPSFKSVCGNLTLTLLKMYGAEVYEQLQGSRD